MEAIVILLIIVGIAIIANRLGDRSADDLEGRLDAQMRLLGICPHCGEDIRKTYATHNCGR